MKLLKSALYLRSLVQEAHMRMQKHLPYTVHPINRMFLKINPNTVHELRMEEFTNDFVHKKVLEYQNTEAFVMTDLATMDVKGKTVTYLLFKAYHVALETGMVYYQVIDASTHQAVGELQFSNPEANPFYPVKSPEIEESSCNAMETETEKKGEKHIVFFIGHMDENRLLYDIQRLIIDTVHNVSKHPKLHFSFTISIARYGAVPTPGLIKQVAEVENFTKQQVLPAFPNTSFVFTFEQDDSLN